MSWGFSVPKRIVIADRSYRQDNLVSRRNIRGPISALLVTCHDSREVALRLYYATFGRPILSPLKWHYDGSLHRDDVMKKAEDLIPNLFGSEIPTLELVTKINRYLNSHPEKRDEKEFDRFTWRFEKTKGVVYPNWFYADEDILYMRFTDIKYYSWTQGGLWSPKTLSTSGRVKHLALKLGYMQSTSSSLTPTNAGRSWTDLAYYPNLGET
jgi:hypothetical protein